MSILAIFLLWSRNILYTLGGGLLIASLTYQLTSGAIPEILSMKLWLWGVVLLVIAGIISLAEWRWVSKKFPSIKVKVIDDPSGYYLEIFNSGSVGKFKAQLEILDSGEYILPQSKQVVGHWEIGRREPEIMKGQKDKIKIATLEMPPRIPVVSYRLYCDVGGREVTWVNSSSWNPFLGHTGVWFVIKATISATPELKGRVFIKTYRLDRNGLGEVNKKSKKEEVQA